MKWKKVKAKTRSINFTEEKKKKRKQVGRPQEPAGQIQDSGCTTEQTFELLLSNQRHEERGRRKGTAIKEGTPEGLCLPSGFKQDRAQEDVFGKLRKVSVQTGIIYRCCLKEASSIRLSKLSATFSQPALEPQGLAGYGVGGELSYVDLEINIPIVPSPPPFDSCWGSHWSTPLETIDLPNWKPLANLNEKPLAIPTGKLLANPTGNH